MDMNITLPESWKSFIDAEVAAGGHGSAAEYLHTLLMQAKLRKARDKVEALLDEGLNSGPATEWTKQDWEEIRREIHQRHARRDGNAP